MSARGRPVREGGRYRALAAFTLVRLLGATPDLVISPACGRAAYRAWIAKTVASDANGRGSELRGEVDRLQPATSPRRRPLRLIVDLIRDRERDPALLDACAEDLVVEERGCLWFEEDTGSPLFNHLVVLGGQRDDAQLEVRLCPCRSATIRKPLVSLSEEETMLFTASTKLSVSASDALTLKGVKTEFVARKPRTCSGTRVLTPTGLAAG